MRLAIAIIGLMLLVGFLFQGVFENALSTNDASTWRGGVSSIFVAGPWLFASMYVFWLPRLAAVLFIVAGVFAWLAAATTSHTDLWVWGIAAFILAAGSFLSARQEGSKDAQNRDPDEMMPMTASVSTTTGTAPIAPMPIVELSTIAPVPLTYPCPMCGTAMDMEQQYCQECGTPAPERVNIRPAIPV